MKRLGISSWIAGGIGLAAVGFVACSDSETKNPVPPDGGIIILVPDGGTPTDTGGPAPTDGGGGTNCPPPTTNLEFLNSCTDGTCFPFANTKARLPLLNADGTLPPAP